MYPNLLIIALSVVELGNVGDKMGRSKGMARYMALTELADEAIMLGRVDVSKAKEELKLVMADPSLKASLVKDIEEKFEIVDKDLEHKLEQGLELGIRIFDDVKASIEFAKAFKKK